MNATRERSDMCSRVLCSFVGILRARISKRRTTGVAGRCSFCHFYSISPDSSMRLTLPLSIASSPSSSTYPLVTFITHRQPCSDWTRPAQRTRHFSVQDSSHPNEPAAAGEPDLFDYFDPLLSPHQYPHGIDATKKTKKKRQGFTVFGLNEYESPPSTTLKEEEEDEPEDFLFDPRLSPHDYPYGTDAGPQQQQHFLPPNLYRNEKPSKGLIGILLIDHGSRRASSNEQLQHIAIRYQSQLPKHYVVYASHMEIASPTIAEGIEYLTQIPNMSTILCHPYFLSPGRHVSEDVPTLIREAVQSEVLVDKVDFIENDSVEDSVSSQGNSLVSEEDDSKKIQLYMTDAVGSDLDCMINVVDQMIQQTLIRVLPQPLN